MVSNIVRLRTANSAVAEAEDEQIEDLRGLMWSDQHVRGRTWKKLAEDAGVSYSTVRNFASETTRRPHHTTLMKLMAAMGLRFALVPMGAKIEQEINLKQYQERKKA